MKTGREDVTMFDESPVLLHILVFILFYITLKRDNPFFKNFFIYFN